jgi:transcriptional regulator with XRE-family HTH domain
VIIGERVKERMEAAKLTQTELARRVRLTQPTINNLIYRNKAGSSHIHKIARELGTTPEYLTGETDDPLRGAPSEPEVSGEEVRLLQIYRQLAKKDRSALKHLIERMAGLEVRQSAD